MRITILSTTPEAFDSFRASHVVARASSSGAAALEVVDIRDYAEGSYRKIDDSPYGGGPGMVLRVDTVSKAIADVRTGESRVVMLSPKGFRFDQKKAREFASLSHLVLVNVLSYALVEALVVAADKDQMTKTCKLAGLLLVEARSLRREHDHT